MCSESEGHDRTTRILEELWELIQDSRALVEETMRLAAECQRIQQELKQAPTMKLDEDTEQI